MESADVVELSNRISELEIELKEIKAKQNRKPKKQLEPATCEVCGKVCKNIYILKNHIAKLHNENRKFELCPFCKKTLSSKYYLRYHIANTHPDKVNEEI